jgi:hypothetical protein
VLLSESLPSCPWTDCCSTPLSAARVDELIASGWLFNLPSTKSARDCRGFPSLESVHLLAVLPVVQSRASRVLSDSNNHPLAAPREHLGLDTPANRDTAPKSSCGRMPDTTASDWPPKELIEPRCTRQEPTDPQCSFSLTTPGEPDSIAPKSHLGETRADPPIRHPKRKTSMASRFQQLAIPRSLPSVWCPWRTRSTGPTSDSRKSCCTRKDDRKPSTHDARRYCFHPPDAPGLLEPANRSQRTQIARWTSAHDSPKRPLRGEMARTHRNRPLEDLWMLDRLDGFSKPKPPHRLHIWTSTTLRLRVRFPPEGAPRPLTTRRSKRQRAPHLNRLEDSSKLEPSRRNRQGTPPLSGNYLLPKKEADTRTAAAVDTGYPLFQQQRLQANYRLPLSSRQAQRG